MNRAGKALFASAIGLLTCPCTAAADYDPMTLYQMLMRADTVVTGRITQVQASTYDLEVSESFHPADVPSVLSVLRIDGLPRADRWVAYAPGQELVLFATGGGDAPLEPLGEAGEGEVPRDAETVYLPNLARSDRTQSSARIAGGELVGYPIGIEEFSAAIEGFFRCFSRRPAEAPDQSPKLERRCDDAELRDYRTQSWLAGHLAGISERAIGGG
jgi:hypothetical protein